MLKKKKGTEKDDRVGGTGLHSYRSVTQFTRWHFHDIQGGAAAAVEKNLSPCAGQSVRAAPRFPRPHERRSL